ncbi:helicase-related protein [Benzoatithermus flavus]|uniref:Helicase-related protein n=1 Tax=Benzoatithermus flavus TaxID=3108223 RepID=A0ABU8XP33_9PROT
MSTEAPRFQVGSLVSARGREWVVLPDSSEDDLCLRPLGGADEDAILIHLPLEPAPSRPRPATFPLPNPAKAGGRASGLLLRDAMRLKLSAGAGPFRSFGHLGVEPRAYQLVPLLMALRQEVVRLLIADDVGIGKTIEAGLIARELLDRGEIGRLAVICPPHLCEQWQSELATKFHIEAAVVRSGTAARLERGLPQGQTIFDHHPFTIVSLDYIKRPNRLDDFARACPEFVIVEEAHGCVLARGRDRQQRFELLKRLAQDPKRHMVFLTATPHSGDEEAFHNLLGLLDPAFRELGSLPEGEARRRLRARLASHFVQRQRADIREWKDSTVFPDRETREVTYQLTGPWGELFDEVLRFARAMVKRTENASKLQQRMSFWAALALLRCVSSSPAAAAQALRTRLKATLEGPEAQQLEEIEALAADTVLDGADDQSLTADETVPAGTTEEAARDAKALQDLIARAERLKGEAHDPKLALLRREVEGLIAAGFRPVVFCRYLATAHYLAAELQGPLGRKGAVVDVVTGELTPEEREERIAAFAAAADGKVPVLIATDCLSEGINLQQHFTAVVHYDLVWNPTRHEQREGRVDRFGQTAKVVRALMLYGANNPVDGAVLRVILKKAERIRKELGVSVPLPADTNQVMQAVMRAVLLSTGAVKDTRQLRLDFPEIESADRQVETLWQSAKEKARATRTIFAQARLRPEEVLPEWEKAKGVLGGAADVERFVKAAAEALGAPLHERRDGWRLPVDHLPEALQEQLATLGIERPVQLVFDRPGPSGVLHAHRAHPLVRALAEHLAERALAEEGEIAARCGALFTDAVATRTLLLILRLRTQLVVHKPDAAPRHLLAEECVVARLGRDGPPVLLDDAESRRLLSAPAAKDMPPAQRQRFVRAALELLTPRMNDLAALASTRADLLLEDHVRVRDAAIGRREQRGYRIDVRPCLPVDVIGLWVLVPVQGVL